MDGVFIYEFLFRGGPTSGTDDDTWHVILAREVVDIDGETRLETTKALTPAKAADLGFPLSRILRDLNATALVAADTARREREDLRAELNTLKDARAEAAEAILTAEPERKKFLGLF